MEYKTIICQNENCGKEVIIQKRNSRTKLCEDCKQKLMKEYFKKYNKNYKAQGNHKKENKRHYTRTKLKNIPRIIEVDKYTDYCRKNFNTVEGCLNCICPECIEPEKSDKFLPWESEGFYFEEERIEYEIERSIG